MNAATAVNLGLWAKPALYIALLGLLGCHNAGHEPIKCHGLSAEECEVLKENQLSDFDEFYLDDYRSNGVDDASESIAQYAIESDLSLSELDNIDPDSDVVFRQIWLNVKQILPELWLKDSFSEFHIHSDGEEGTLAYVQLDEYEDDRWIIAFDDVDYSGVDDKEFIHTVIHEFGHVVFLNENQINTEFLEPCETYLLDEGCAYHHSYINRFYQSFWQELIEENTAAEGDEDQLLSFYEKHQDQFISEYAATDPIEDAAEVFTHFVLREKPHDNGQVINRKIRFLHTQKPLVELREQLRNKLSIIRKNRG